jgi:hypothetical protein
VAALLQEQRIPFAVIGAAAMAVHGVTRSTRDLDLFTVQADVLRPETWQRLQQAHVDVRVERGDADDPLAGVVRLGAPDEHPIDVIAGKSPWQTGIVQRSRPALIEGANVPVAAPADLILLKLYAGGAQDAWDIEQLLAGPDRAALTGEVDATIGALPVESRRLWERIRGG